MGYTKSIPLTSYNIWFLRLNSDGDTLWTKTYGGGGEDYGYSLKKTEDGGFIIAGTTNSYGVGEFDFYVIRIDSIGDTLWTKTFGGENNDYAWSVDITLDGGFVIAGEKNAFPETPDGMIIKINESGELIWEKFISTSNPEYLYSISSSADGTYSLAGYAYLNFSAGFNAWLLKLTSIGDSSWSKYFGGELTQRFYSHGITNKSSFICVGRTLLSLGGLPDLYIVKTDSLGNEIWTRSFDYDNDSDEGYSVQQTLDGGYIITGQGRPFDGLGLMWIIKTDSLGNMLWDKTFPWEFPKTKISGPVSPLADVGTSVKQTSDGGYIVAGYRDDLTGPYYQAYIVRIAPDIIPVELTSFTATVERNAVSLNWQTATETNNSGFEIERKQVGSPQSSVGNQDWNQIAFVPGFGTTTEPKSYSFTDENLSSGKYQYRLKQIDFDGNFEYSNTVEVEITSPTEFTLEQNYPNPFNPTTKIKYEIPGQARNDNTLVTLNVYDILGNEIATLVNEQQQPGTYEVEFNVGQNISLSSGVYYYQLRVGGFVETKKMILLR
ncbi:MAG: T9SS type A sorting domain-containing protein [Ignavibacteriales bacterium]|nr:T9SS type A sorting domain-containing protein [Ignavibacteriales bacterium]